MSMSIAATFALPLPSGFWQVQGQRPTAAPTTTLENDSARPRARSHASEIIDVEATLIRNRSTEVTESARSLIAESLNRSPLTYVPARSGIQLLHAAMPAGQLLSRLA